MVRDASGRPIPGARVEVRQQATGLSRLAETSSSGIYTLPSLPIGTYALTAAKPGFVNSRISEINLLVGQTRHIDLIFAVAGQSTEVSVTAAVSEVDQSSAAVGARITGKQLDNLPINGRNWTTILPLIPGATDPGSSDQRTVRFAGHGRDDNNITYDGVDATGISNQPQKTGIRLAIPASAISEFKVDSTLFTVDSADGTGGQVVLASSGGTNSFHGGAMEYLRNSIFDARNPFAPVNPPFRLNQFGANAGGAIVKNKTFFFVAFEGSRQRLDQALQGFTASASYRARVLAAFPQLGPVINSLPAGNLPQASDPNIDRFNGLSPQRIDETSGMVRIDHHLNSRVSAFLRINVDEEISDTPLNNLRDRTVVDNRPINGVFNVTQVFSPTALNETKIGFNQVFSRTVNQTPTPYTLSVSGFTAVNSSQTREEDDTSASLIDNFSLSVGRHSLRMGAEGRRVFTDPGSSATGTLSFANINALALNQLNTAAVTAALPLKRLRKTQAFGFILDEFKASRTLTVTLGLRYQFFNVFHETSSRAVPFDFATCGGFCAPGAQFSTPRTNDFDPRIALAWSPASLNGRTVLRAGYGIYHGDGQLEDQNLPASNDQARYSLAANQIAGLSFPIDSFLATAPGILSPRAQNRNRKDEYSPQWSVSLQQDLPLHVTGSLTYTGNKGTDLQTITYANILNPLTGQRPFPLYGQVEYRTNDSNSTFHALVVSAQRHLHSGVVMGVNYMWSHAINDGSLGGGEADIVSSQNPFCRACERADSAQDIRHFFSSNIVYELPWGAGKRHLSTGGMAGAILGGWSVTGIGTARSALPVNVTISRSADVAPFGYTVNQRPDLVPGVSLIPNGGSTPQQWLNPAAFVAPKPGTFGNAGRDIARGPDMYQLDMGLGKQFRVTERKALQFRWEVFNVFNRAQWGQPSGNVTVPAQFGAITSTINTTAVGTGTSRQMQFMLRLAF
jgi:hypothetical protein